ncbi:MAG: hypothetical protein Q4Q07_03540 [Tissierellia bacterium]|nr:hypothetical protein [Tissierellia bacterium]
MDYEKELKDLKEKLEEATSQKNRAEARLETLEQQEKELLKELEGQGIKPEQLEEEILKLEKEIKELFSSSYELLPKDE